MTMTTEERDSLTPAQRTLRGHVRNACVSASREEINQSIANTPDQPDRIRFFKEWLDEMDADDAALHDLIAKLLPDGAPNGGFRELTEGEVKSFQEYADSNDPPESLIEFNGRHPVCRDRWCFRRDNDYVKILATPDVKALASTSLEIQDACNGTAVAGFLQRVIRHFGQDSGQQSWGSHWGNQNPIAHIVIDKLQSLARMKQDFNSDAWAAVQGLANGEDTYWKIDAGY